MVKAFCEWLASSSSGLGLVIGSTLYAGQRPAAAPDLCTVVLERVPEIVDPERKDARQVTFQLFTRGRGYFTARDEARRIFDQVVNQYGVTGIDGWFVGHISGTGPAWIGQDDKGRDEFSANITLNCETDAGSVEEEDDNPPTKIDPPYYP